MTKRIALALVAVLILPGCLESCGSLTKRLGQAQTAVTGMRQAAKEYYAKKCETVAKKCPTRLTKRPAEECVELMACWDEMDKIFAGTTSAQLAIYTAISLKEAGKEKEADSMLVKIGVMLLDLKTQLSKYGVLPGGM